MSSPSRASTRDRIALREPTLEQLEGKRILDEALDRTLQRPCAIRGIPTLLRKQFLGGVSDLELDPALAQALAESRQLQLDDLRQLLARQRLERDDLVHAIQELRPEAIAQLVLRADVRGHDDHRVAKVDGAALAVRQASVVEQLQQHVEDLGVRLLDLVEEDDGVRPAAHGLRQLPALLVADVAGRRAQEPGDRMSLLVFRHVEPHHRPLVVEHELRERARQLRLPDAGRAEEDERADRPIRVL